jgi:uncharacterized protein YjbJ (UPF0337 family)
MSLQLKRNWNQLKGQLKQTYAALNDDDLKFTEGQEDELLGLLQEKTGEKIESLRKMIFETEEESK